MALAFALGPEILLLDEPTSGVSTAERYGLMETILAAVRNGRTATVFIEHDLDVVRRYAQRVLVFSEGRVVADGSPAEVFAEGEASR